MPREGREAGTNGEDMERRDLQQHPDDDGDVADDKRGDAKVDRAGVVVDGGKGLAGKKTGQDGPAVTVRRRRVPRWMSGWMVEKWRGGEGDRTLAARPSPAATLRHSSFPAHRSLSVPPGALSVPHLEGGLARGDLEHADEGLVEAPESRRRLVAEDGHTQDRVWTGWGVTRVGAPNYRA
jgi:hypothetical protein